MSTGNKITVVTDPEVVLADMPDELRAATERIREKSSQLNETNVTTRHDIGTELITILDDKTGKYGTDVEKSMWAVMPLSRDSLRPMIELARNYTRAEVDTMLAFKHPKTKEGLVWTHFTALTRVKDKEKAFELAEWAATNGKTTKELVGEVIRTSGGPKSKGARPPKRPGSFEASLVDIDQKVKTFENVADKIWLAPGGLDDQFAALLSGQGWKPSTEFLGRLAEVKDRLDNLTIKVMAVGHQISACQAQANARKSQGPVA